MSATPGDGGLGPDGEPDASGSLEERLARCERRTQALLEASLDAVITIDHLGRILEFNPAAERLFGYRRADVLGRSLAERIIPPALREPHRKGLERFLATGEGPVLGRRIEIAAMRADGSELLIELAISEIPTHGPPLFTAYLRDITERTNAERELRQGRSLLSEAEQIAQLGSWLWDVREGGWTGSDGLALILRKLPDPIALRAEGPASFVHPGDRERVAAWARQALETRLDPPEIEARVLRPDGEVRDLLLRASLVLDPHAQPRQLLGSVQDITERRRSEALLRDREVRLVSIVETAADGILVIDDEGRIESFNPAAERLFGWSAAEVIGRNVKVLMPEPDCSQHDGHIRRYLATGVSRIIGTGRVVQGLRRDGSVFPMELAVSVMRIGAAVKFTGIVRDVTERLRTEERLRRSNALLESIRRAHLAYIADKTPREVFEPVLRTFLELTRSAYGFIGEVEHGAGDAPYLRTHAITNIAWDEETRRFFESHAPEGMVFRNLDTLFGSAITSGEPVIADHPDTDPRRGGLPPGHPPLETFVGLPLLRAGQTLGVIGLANRPGGYDLELVEFLQPLLRTCANLIEGYRADRLRQQSEAMLQASKEAAEAASRAKSEFLANMSHEVRTPAAALLGYADLLQEPNLAADDRRHALRAIRRNGQHLLQIVDDILDLSKIEAGRMELDWVSYSPWQVVLEVVSLLRAAATERSILLQLEPRGRLPRSVLLDPTRTLQVLANFVGNAIKFSATGGCVRLRLSVEPADAAETRLGLRYEVEDEGIGMTPEQARQVFRPFQQADTSTTRKYGGTGLGLSIASRLVEAMGGRIEVRSEPGRGSCFSAWIPLRDAEPEPVWVEAEVLRLEAVAERTPVTVATPGLEGRKILIVDDNPDLRWVLQHDLGRAGLVVTAAEDGRVAVERAFGEAYDAIVMDMQMPELDGYGAARSLRRGGYTGPIIALTAHALRDDRDRCLEAGCSDYLTKPVNLETLRRRIAEHLGLPIADDGAARGDRCEAGEPLPAGLVGAFLESLPDHVRAMRAALEASDPDRLGRLAHQTRGVAAMYGFPALGETAGLIEDACREGQEAELVRELVEEIEAIAASLRASHAASREG